MKKYQLFILLLGICIIFLGCTSTQKGTSVGALSGAAIGGIIGHQSGHGGEGAAIGGAVGALGGYVVGEKMKGKFCPVCGTQYDDEVMYCSKDGAELKNRQ